MSLPFSFFLNAAVTFFLLHFIWILILLFSPSFSYLPLLSIGLHTYRKGKRENLLMIKYVSLIFFCDQFTIRFMQLLFVGIKADGAVYDTTAALFFVHCHVFLLPHYQLLGCRKAVNIIFERLPLPNDTGN